MTTNAHTNCLRCGRALTSTRSQATGYGPTCAAKIQRASNVIDLAQWKANQIAAAVELIEDGAIVPAGNATFELVSTDGRERYKAGAHWCTCEAGQAGRRCYHRAAASLLMAA